MKKLFPKLVILLIFIAGIILTPNKNVQAVTYDTKTIYTTADACVKSLYPNTNFDTGSQLWVQNSETNKIRSFMYFDLSVIPAGSTVITASVQVRSWLDSGCWGDPGQFYLSLANAAWSESTITWNNKPESAINTSNPLSCTSGYLPLDAKYPVQQIIDGAKTNHGFFIVNEAGPSYLRTFFSRENGQEHAPKITVFYSLPESTPSGQPSEDNNPNQGSKTAETTSGTSKSGITAGTKAAPATKTSTAIKPPGELLAKDAGMVGTAAINLTWQKSETENIDGYKVFRSEKENEGFENIAIADKNTLTYTDIVGDEKTYYYFVRAYKGNEESASSNTANTNAEKIMEEKAPTTKNTSWDWKTIAIVIGSGIIILAGLIFLFFKIIWPKIKDKKA